jgi:hypothetical protein
MRHPGATTGVTLIVIAWLVGCGSPEVHSERCTSDGSTSLGSTISPGPDCNGLRYQAQCEAAGLPAAYGVEKGCTHPALSLEGATCKGRKAGLKDCVPLEGLLCCPP